MPAHTTIYLTHSDEYGVENPVHIFFVDAAREARALSSRPPYRGHIIHVSLVTYRCDGPDVKIVDQRTMATYTNGVDLTYSTPGPTTNQETITR